MKEYKITLESDVLDPAFVSKAKDFEKKLENNEMTDEEIKAADDELIELFNKHDLSEEDSEELAAAKRERDLALAKKEVAEAETIVKLTEQKERFKKDFPEVVPLIDKKLVKLQKDAEKKEAEEKQVALDKLFGIAKKEIAECPYDELQAMGEKYKQYPEMVELVRKRHEDEKPEKEQAALAEKLRAKKEWSYKELEALGIKPTGNDMTVAGVRLEKEYLLSIYSVRR